jgi:hypothetical protein
MLIAMKRNPVMATALLIVGSNAVADPVIAFRLSPDNPLQGLPAISADGAIVALPLDVSSPGDSMYVLFVPTGKSTGEKIEIGNRLAPDADQAIARNLGVINTRLSTGGFRPVSLTAFSDVHPSGGDFQGIKLVFSGALTKRASDQVIKKLDITAKSGGKSVSITINGADLQATSAFVVAGSTRAAYVHLRDCSVNGPCPGVWAAVQLNALPTQVRYRPETVEFKSAQAAITTWCRSHKQVSSGCTSWSWSPSPPLDQCSASLDVIGTEAQFSIGCPAGSVTAKLTGSPKAWAVVSCDYESGEE